MTSSKSRADMMAGIIERSGIDEKLIHAFYAKVRKDSLLKPIFEQRIVNWEPHLQRTCAFWSSFALMSGVYHAQPMEKYPTLSIDALNFGRRLALFEDSAHQACPATAATPFIQRARRVIEKLRLGIARQAGIILTKGERLRLATPETAAAVAANNA